MENQEQKSQEAINKEITDKAERKQRRLANLKPVKKGQSGNPKGRPPGSLSLISLLKQELAETIKSRTGEEMEIARALMKKLVQRALTEDDIKAIKEILDRVEGKPRETMEIGGEGNLPFLIKIIKDDK